MVQNGKWQLSWKKTELKFIDSISNKLGYWGCISIFQISNQGEWLCLPQTSFTTRPRLVILEFLFLLLHGQSLVILQGQKEGILF